VYSCEKHKKALSNPKPPPDAPLDATKFDKIFRISGEHLPRSALKSKFKIKSLPDPIQRKLRNPGTNAAWGSTRSAGGRAAAIRSVLRQEDLSEWGLLDMFEFRPGEVYERHGTPLPSYSKVVDISSDYVESRQGKLQARVELCLEPLKCRVITKGEAVPYWLAQTFQKHAWKALQRYPCFVLTGQSLDASHLYGVVLKTEKLGLPFTKFVSGDYSAATDGLSLDANTKCLSSILASAGADEKETKVCQAVLGAHLVSYPDKLVKEAKSQNIDLEPFTMKNGQLMGSLLSFPVLCAINVVAYWHALEEYAGREFDLYELPVLVNGDDICFMSDDEFYLIWQKWIARAGFELSQGKNYISSNYVTINSAAWIWKGGSDFVRLRHPAVGLLLKHAHGPSSIALRKNLQDLPLQGQIELILREANNSERALDRVKHYFKDSLAILTGDHNGPGKYNLFVPLELGGCGIPLPPCLRDSPEVYITEFQKLLAGACLDYWKSLTDEVLDEEPSCPFNHVTVTESASGRFKKTMMSSSEQTFHNIDVPTVRERKGHFRLVGIGPLERGQRRFGDGGVRVAPDLLNAQVHDLYAYLQTEKPKYITRRLTSRKINTIFAVEKKIKRPLTFPYQMIISEGPTDDASLPPQPKLVRSTCHVDVDNMAEMATGQSHFTIPSFDELQADLDADSEGEVATFRRW